MDPTHVSPFLSPLPRRAAGIALCTVFAVSAAAPSFAAQKKSAKVAVPVPAVCEGEYVMDLPSGKTLHAKNAEVPMLPASMSKMMTALMMADLVAERRVRLDEPVRAYLRDGGQYIPGAPSGDYEDITVEQALRATAIVSNNRAARALERLISERQGQPFSVLARAKAVELGMADTYLVEGSGISDEARSLGLSSQKKPAMSRVVAWLRSFLPRTGEPNFNVSTPADISRMTAAFSSDPRYAFLHPIFSSSRVVDDSAELKKDPALGPLRRVMTLKGHLKNDRPGTVLAQEPEDVTGKTGYTVPAGASMTLVDHNRVVITVMQCPAKTARRGGPSARNARIAELRAQFSAPAAATALTEPGSFVLARWDPAFLRAAPF